MLAELANGEDSASDLSIEIPRSCSVPGLNFKLSRDYYSDEEGEDDDETDSHFEEGFANRRVRKGKDSELEKKQESNKDDLDGNWQYKVQRDFQHEIRTFLTSREERKHRAR